MNDVYLIGFAAGDPDDEEAGQDFACRFTERDAIPEEIDDRKFNFGGYEGFCVSKEGAE